MEVSKLLLQILFKLSILFIIYFIFYLVVKLAVKNGIIEAHRKLETLADEKKKPFNE